jgi:hypothetical protein
MCLQATNPRAHLIAILDPQDGKEVAVDLPAPIDSGSGLREG